MPRQTIPETTRIMILTRDLQTPIGYYAAGTPVEWVTDTETTVTVRMCRIGTSSYTLTLPNDAVSTRLTLRTACTECGKWTLDRGGVCPLCVLAIQRHVDLTRKWAA